MLWIFGIAFLSVVAVSFLRHSSPEFAQLFPVAAVILLLSVLMPTLIFVLSAAGDLADRAGIAGEAVGVVLKGAGIGLVTHFGAGICNDCGQRALGEAVGYCGQVATVALAVPMILQLADKISEIQF